MTARAMGRPGGGRPAGNSEGGGTRPERAAGQKITNSATVRNGHLFAPTVRGPGGAGPEGAGVTVNNGSPFDFSFVEGPTDTRPRRVSQSWGEFMARLAGCEIRGELGLEEYLRADRATRAAQKAGHGWIPAVFRAGGRRVDDDVLGTTAVVGDLDDGKLDRAEITRRLNGYAFGAHTGYSHAPGSPRFRVVVP